MKIKMMICLLIAMLFLYSTQTFGQFTTVPTKINTPRGPVTVKTTQPAPWLKFHHYPSKSGNKKHKFYVVLLNDSVINVKAKINIKDTVHFLTWFEGE